MPRQPMPGWRFQTSLFRRGLSVAGLSCTCRAGPPANSGDLTARCGSPLAHEISHGAGAAGGCGRHSQVSVLGSATTLPTGTLLSPPPSGPSEHTRAQERECRRQRAEMWPRPGIRSHHLPFSTTCPHLPATPILSDEATINLFSAGAGRTEGRGDHGHLVKPGSGGRGHAGWPAQLGASQSGWQGEGGQCLFSLPFLTSFTSKTV